MKLKYLVVGAGAIGGAIGAYLADAKKDVTFIDLEPGVQAIKEHGFHMTTPHADYFVPAKAEVAENYHDTPDVVFICVKTYFLDSIIPLLDRVCTPDTLVLPLCNALDIGSAIEAKMHTKAQVIGGVAYVAVVQEAPGHTRQKLPFYRVVFGPRNGAPITKLMWKVRQDMLDAGMAAELVPDAVCGALRKFVRVSTIAGAECYFNCNIGPIRDDPEKMAFIRGLANEIVEIANTRGTPFYDDALEDFETAMSEVFPEYACSMKHDMDLGRPMELDTMLFDVYDMGKSLGLEMKHYGILARHFGHIK